MFIKENVLRATLLFMTVLFVTGVFALSVEQNVIPPEGGQIHGFYYNCDRITWKDASGQDRTASLVIDSASTTGKAEKGGHMQVYEYMNGGQKKVCSSFSGWGFGSTINHGGFPGSCAVGWLSSSCDAFDRKSGFVFLGAHHAIWQFGSKVSFHGAGTSPYMGTTRQYVICEGTDQMQYALTFDVAHIAVDSIDPAFWDSRSPYNDFNWWGNSNFYPKNIYELGTKFCGQVNTDTRTFDLRTPYNLCPYLSGWYNKDGYDDEMGFVQTRLIANHFAGRGAMSSGNTGTISSSDQFDFQLSDYQGYTGGRMCWQADKPNGMNQGPANTFGYETYSLTSLIGRHSDAGVSRLINEANAIQNSTTTLTASIGRVQTRGIEGAGMPVSRDWDKPGFDQVYRTFNLIASNNTAEGTLTLPGGASVKNPTFVVEDYTMPANPAVYLNGSEKTDNNGCWISVDTATHRAWITFNATFSGAQTVKFQGPGDAAGIIISGITVTPAVYPTTQATTVTIGVSTAGALVQRVEIDARSIGGSLTNMQGSNGSFTYSSNVSTNGSIGSPQGKRRIVIRAFDSNGKWRGADTFAVAQKPDLVIYRDGSPISISSWRDGGTGINEISTGAYEGSKSMQITYLERHDGNQDHAGFDFGQVCDFRPYKYFVMAYKGPANGRGFSLTMGGANQYHLPAVNTWASIAIPITEFRGNFTKGTVGGIHLWIDTGAAPLGGGSLFIDDMYLTTNPGMADYPTESFVPLSGVRSTSSASIRMKGRSLLYSIPAATSLLILDLRGRSAGRVQKSMQAQQGHLSVTAPGLYVIRAVEANRVTAQQILVK